MPRNSSIRAWLEHAFAVDDGPLTPTAEQRKIVDRLCREVVRRHLTTPAIAFLEMSRPLNFMGSQAIHFFHPLITAVADTEGHRHLAEFLEHRGSIDYLRRRIEQLEADALAQAGQRDQTV